MNMDSKKPLETFETAVSVPMEVSQCVPVPRLRIHHFLIWTFLAAGLISFSKFYFKDVLAQQKGIGIPHLLLNVGPIALGLTLMIVGCCFYWRKKGIHAFGQPGEWLALMLTLNIFFYFGLSLLPNTNQNPPPFEIYEYLIAMFSIPVVVLYATGWIRVSHTFWWKLFFLLNTIRFSAFFILSMAPVVVKISDGYGGQSELRAILQPYLIYLLNPPWSHFVFIFLLSLALFFDFRKRHTEPKMRWSHWFGSVTWGAALILSIVMYFMRSSQ